MTAYEMRLFCNLSTSILTCLPSVRPITLTDLDLEPISKGLIIGICTSKLISGENAAVDSIENEKLFTFCVTYCVCMAYFSKLLLRAFDLSFAF